MSKFIAKISFFAFGAAWGAGRAFSSEHEIINPIGSDTFEELLLKITNGLFVLSIRIVSIMILYGGFQMLTASGDPGKIETGKKTITYAIWGFVAVILAGGVAAIIKEIIGVSTPTL